jgi:hypothetical protein
VRYDDRLLIRVPGAEHLILQAQALPCFRLSQYAQFVVNPVLPKAIHQRLLSCL